MKTLLIMTFVFVATVFIIGGGKVATTAKGAVVVTWGDSVVAVIR